VRFCPVASAALLIIFGEVPQEAYHIIQIKGVGIIGAVNPHIGYEVAACIAREAIINGKFVRELRLLYDVLAEKELALILNPYEMTEPSISGAALFDRE
jgi:aspartate ammonia-lyase